MYCDCYGRTHLGETTQPGRLDGSERDEAQDIPCALDRHELQSTLDLKPAPTEKEARFTWEDIDKHADMVEKDMIAKEGPDILTGHTEKEGPLTCLFCAHTLVWISKRTTKARLQCTACHATYDIDRPGHQEGR